MSAPSFLTIPRELRNIIYKNLHHPVQPKHDYDEKPHRRFYQVGINHAPLVNVLLMIHQIYREYWEMLTQVLCAIIDM